MSETLNFITTERQHVVDLTQSLIKGIEPRFFHDPQDRIRITVDGDWDCGKSIIADATYAQMFSENKKDCTYFVRSNPSHKADYGGQETIFAFSNVWINSLKDSLAEIENEKNYGGVEFVQYPDKMARAALFWRTPDIEITMRQLIQSKRLTRKLPKPVRTEIMMGTETKAPDTPNARMIRFKIHSRNLLSSEQFKKTWNELSSIGQPCPVGKIFPKTHRLMMEVAL